MMKICPNCNQRFSWSLETGPDFVHQCTIGGSAIRLDSVLKVGNWTDADGSTGSVVNTNLQGRGSRAGGIRAGIDNIDSMNIHGKRKSLHRLRQHYEYIEVK